MKSQRSLFILIALATMLAACSASAPVAGQAAVPIVRAKPDWFNIKMTDVRTGQTFSINDFAGKVVLLETMATWCINCVTQDKEVKKLEALGYSQDMVAVSLDEDLSEDAATLKEYANTFGFDWYFAISPLAVDRALGNLYSAEFINPPLTPMLFIDRQGGVYSLPLGPIKRAGSLQITLTPYLIYMSPGD